MFSKKFDGVLPCDFDSKTKLSRANIVARSRSLFIDQKIFLYTSIVDTGSDVKYISHEKQS